MVLNVLLWPLMSLSLLSGFGVLLFGAICPPLGCLCGWLCNGSFWLLEGGVNWAIGCRAAISGCPVRPIGGCGAFTARWDWPWHFRGSARRGAGALRCWPCGSRWASRRRRGGTIATGSIAPSSAWATAARCSSSFPRARRCSTTPARWASLRPAARTISEFLWDRGLSASRRRRAFPSRHRPLQRPAGIAGEVLGGRGLRFAGDVREREPRGRGAARCHRPAQRARARGAGRRPSAGGDDCLVEVLHPPRHGILGSDNANSLVLAVEYRGRRILLPGDLESPGLDDMLAEEPRPCEVLMAPHHGSRKSNSPALAAWCKPRWVVFSGDGRWNLPEIDATYRAVGGQTLHTHNCGAIRVRIRRRRKVSPFVASSTRSANLRAFNSRRANGPLREESCDRISRIDDGICLHTDYSPDHWRRGSHLACVGQDRDNPVFGAGAQRRGLGDRLPFVPQKPALRALLRAGHANRVRLLFLVHLRLRWGPDRGPDAHVFHSRRRCPVPCGSSVLCDWRTCGNSGDDRQKLPFQFSIMALLVLMVLVSVFFGSYQTFGNVGVAIGALFVYAVIVVLLLRQFHVIRLRQRRTFGTRIRPLPRKTERR